MPAPSTRVSAMAMTGDKSAMRLERSVRGTSSSRMRRLAAFDPVMVAVRAAHQQADALGAERPGREGLREPAARDDGDAVRHLEDLVEVLADDEDRRAAARQP